jgi:hypothetical protein
MDDHHFSYITKLTKKPLHPNLQAYRNIGMDVLRERDRGGVGRGEQFGQTSVQVEYYRSLLLSMSKEIFEANLSLHDYVW